MTSSEPGPTPEGLLIKRVREGLRPRLTVADAAQRAGISAEMWGHIERGHRSAGKGKGRVPVRASASTLAHMAFVVGVTVEQLANVGRDNAAAVLRMMGANRIEPEATEIAEIPVDRGTVVVRVAETLPDEDRELVRRQAEELAAFLDKRRQDQQE